MIIKVERTGGVAGLSSCSEMDSKDLPVQLKKTLTKLTHDYRLPAPLKSAPVGAADHYSYKVTVDYDGSQRVFTYNQYELQDDLKSLISYVEKSAAKK